MGHKAAETICNINNASGSGTANGCTAQRWFKKFCKGAESHNDKECSGRPSEGENDQLRAINKALLSQLHRSCLRAQRFSVWSKPERWKRPSRWLPHELTGNFKKRSFWSVIFSYSTQQRTISWLDCEVRRKVDFLWQPATISSVAGPRRSSKALPKFKPAPKRGHGHWWSATGLIHHSFLNPSETITSETYAQQIDEMHQKQQNLQPSLV